MNYTLYCHTNKINGKKYIGITGQKPNLRWGKDGKNYSMQPKFYNAIIKYGWNNFIHEVLLDNLTKQEASNLEQFYIQKYNTIEEGYNVDPGGILTGTKQVRCITTNKIYNSVNEAAQDNGISASNLSHCLRGDQLTAGKKDGIKLEWTFVFNENNQTAIKKNEIREDKKKQKVERNLLFKKEFEKGETVTNIAKKFNTSKETVSKGLKSIGVEVKPAFQTRKQKILKYDRNYNFICEYDSMTEALISIGETDSQCSRLKKACEEEWRIFKGYHWKKG